MIALILFLVATLAALGTLLLEYLQDAIRSGGIAFVVAGLALAAWLFWTRRRDLLLEKQLDDDTTDYERLEGNPGMVAGLTMVGLVAAILAHLLHSPFLAWGTFMFLLATAAYAEYGSRGVHAAGPVLVLLLFLKPIPQAFEPWAHLGLQASATRLTMMMLDFLRIFFFSEGNVLGLISQQKLYPELFHGVHWLYPAMFIAIGWGVYFRYHWFRTFLNVCHTVFWALLWNAMRATVLMANKEWGGSWIDTPSMMVVSDYLTLSMILFFAWSGDQFLSSMMTTRRKDTLTEKPDPTEMRSLMSLRWRFGAMQWGLIAGLLAICLLSGRLAGRYGWGMTSPSALKTAILMPAEINSWKVGEESTSELTLYDGTVVSMRSWPLERDGRKLTLAVASPGSVDPKSLWFSKWMGWRIDREAESDMVQETQGPGNLIRLARLPGELNTVVTVGTDRYGEMHPSTAPWQFWYRLPELLLSNAKYVVGIADEASDGRKSLPAAHTVTLSWPSAKPLEAEKTKQLIEVWEQAYPLIVDQLRTRPTN
jgi:hypothetical protein